MLLAVVSSLIYSREIRWNDFVPDLTKLWNVLELRLLVLCSFGSQLVLIFFGNRRKYIADKWLQLMIWLAYLLADLFATVALGTLFKDSKNPSVDSNLIIVAIWAPFLLVHLGGPDTTTAYSLEDNELWLRHLLGFGYQLIVAVLVVWSSWNGSPLNYVTVPVLVAGIIKYGERSWSLWKGSSKTFRESILPPPDPGPNYAKFMDDYTAKEAEGYGVSLDVETTPIKLDHSQGDIANQEIPNASSLRNGFYFFKIFECLFADLILSLQDLVNSRDFFKSTDWNHAFQVIEAELELMYNKLYTKAVVTNSQPGIFLKLVSFFCTLSAFVSFYFLIDKGHMDYDHVITFVLFIGAILLEIYAVIVLLSSSWAMLWLSKHKNWRVDLLYKCISRCQKCFQLSHTIRWSNLMSQFNLIRFCLKQEHVKCIKIQKLLPFYKSLEKYYYTKTEDVHPKLKELIFYQLTVKSVEATNIEACKKLCAQRGDRVLDEWKCGDREINRSIKEVEFDQSILLWHIATDLCYYSDEPHNLSRVTLQSRETSQLLSDYMLYLLVVCPFMLPNGIGEIRFEDTCAEAGDLLQERKYVSTRNQACKMILVVNTKISPSEFKGDRSKSVLFDACRLAKSLQRLETEENWSKERKWKMISQVWVEMLCHAASQCRGHLHARQLSQGGELLTHVWLLMAHLGITEQVQISKGHARAKLKLK